MKPLKKIHFHNFAVLLSAVLLFAVTLPSIDAAAQDTTRGAEASPDLTAAEVQELNQRIRALRTEIRELEQGHRSSRPLDVGEVLRAVPRPHSAANIFRWVRDNIDFEPYLGAMRGPAGTLVAGSGNAVDQAVLLRALYEQAGHKSRFVVGTLVDGDAQELLSQFAGGASIIQIARLDRGGLFEDADASSAAHYLELVAQHVWLEVEEGDQWRPADPVLAPLFGMTTARAQTRSDDLPERFATSLEIQLVGRLDDGQQATHLTVSGPMPRYAYRAVTLGFTEDAARRGALRPTLTLDGRSTHGQPIPVANLEHLELRFTMVAGQRQSRWTQTLFRKDSGANIFAFDQQHVSLTVLPGWTSNDQVARLGSTATSAAAGKVDAWIQAQRRRERVASPIETRRQIQTVLDDIGPLLAFAYLRNLDRVTFAMADSLGVRPILQRPRIVTTAIMGQADRYFIDIELRGDAIDAMPMKGVPPVVATGFIGLYGRVKNQLAGELVEATTGRAATTVNTVFQGAQRERVPFTTVISTNLSVLDGLAIEAHLKESMRELASRQGKILLAPTRKVTIDGLDHYGWWAIHPSTGAVEGFTHDALLTQRATAVSVRPARELHDTMRGSLELAGRFLRAIEESTQSTARYTSAICPARNDLLTLSRATCATTKPLDLPNLQACLRPTNEAGSGPLAMGARSCTDQIEPTQCGAVVVDSLLRGRMAVVNPTEMAELQKRALAKEPVSLPRPPVCR